MLCRGMNRRLCLSDVYLKEVLGDGRVLWLRADPLSNLIPLRLTAKAPQCCNTPQPTNQMGNLANTFNIAYVHSTHDNPHGE